MGYHYTDLVKDGRTNQAAFNAILANRVSYEINLALSVDSGMRAPRGIRLCQLREWYAEAAAKIDPARLSAEDLAKIVAGEFETLIYRVQVMGGSIDGLQRPAL